MKPEAKSLAWSILRAILFVIAAVAAICGLEQIGNIAQAYEVEAMVAQQVAIAVLAIGTLAVLFGPGNDR